MRRPAVILILSLIPIGLILRWPGLTESIWFDEAYRTFLVLRPDNARNILLHDVHNPLYNAFMYLWIRLFGDSELAIRTPSLLANAATILLIGAWAAKRFSPRVALVAAAWLALSPVSVWYGAEAKNSMFTVFFTALAALGIDRLLHRRTYARAAAAGLCVAFALYTDFQSLLGIVPVGVLAAVVLARRPREPHGARPWLCGLLALSVASLLVAPLIVFKAARVNELARDYARYFHPYEVLWILMNWFPTGNALYPVDINSWALPTAILSLALIPIYALAARASIRSLSGLTLLCLTAGPLLCLYLGTELLVASGSRMRIYQERNLLVMLPFVAVALALGAQNFRNASLRIAATIAVLTLAATSTLLMLTRHADVPTVMYPNPDWRSAGRVMLRIDPAPIVVSRTPLLPLRYYVPRATAIEADRGAPPAAKLAELLTEHETVWFIKNPAWFDVTDAELAEMNQLATPIETHEFRSLTLYKFQRVSRTP